MMSWKIGLLFLLMMLALIGCTGLGENKNVQAEAIPSATLAPTNTLVPSPLPPTATRPPLSTMPPTWTPEPLRALPTREATAVPTATPSPTPILVEGDGCAEFYPLLEANEPVEMIFQGETASISWNPIAVPGYQYLVQLYHPAGMITVAELVGAAQFTFSAEQLNSPGYTFGWQVQPVFDEETLVCTPISGEIYVEPYFE